MTYSFYQNNLELIYYLYGLTFFTMGVAIGIKNHHISTFKLANNLWALSAFGLSYSFAEWMTIYIPLHLKGTEVYLPLILVETLLTGLSFTLLFHFGLGLLADILGGKRYLALIPWVFFCVWLFSFFWHGNVADIVYNDDWHDSLHSFARYFLALPGSVLTAYALYLQVEELKSLGVKSLEFDLKAASLVFVVFGVLAGAIVNDGPFFPANLINRQVFAATTGIPVEILRAACALTIAWFSIRILRIFEIEMNHVIREVEKYMPLLDSYRRNHGVTGTQHFQDPFPNTLSK